MGDLYNLVTDDFRLNRRRITKSGSEFGRRKKKRERVWTWKKISVYYKSYNVCVCVCFTNVSVCVLHVYVRCVKRVVLYGLVCVYRYVWSIYYVVGNLPHDKKIDTSNKTYTYIHIFYMYVTYT